MHGSQARASRLPTFWRAAWRWDETFKEPQLRQVGMRGAPGEARLTWKSACPGGGPERISDGAKGGMADSPVVARVAELA